jgi:hypothetical protein
MKQQKTGYRRLLEKENVDKYKLLVNNFQKRTIMADNLRTLIYINAYASMYSDSDLFIKYMNNKLGMTDWISCNNDLRFLPEKIGEIITPEFLQGVAAGQHKQIKNGGVFINPYILGLTSNFDIWATIIWKMDNFNQTIMYLDIPFDEYEKMADNVWKVDEKTYNKNTESITKLVYALKENCAEYDMVH